MAHTIPADDLIGRLASEFSRMICEHLTTEEIDTILRVVPIPDHEFMTIFRHVPTTASASEKLVEIVRRHFSAGSDVDIRFWTWSLVKSMELAYRRTTHTIARYTVAGILERYANFYVWHTGGGCFAFRLDCDAGEYILMTTVEDAQIPDMDARRVALGRYAANGEVIDEVMSQPVDRVETWIEEALASARDPVNVSDYFAKHLGASHGDETLRAVLVDSPCGQSCRRAIDAAATLTSCIDSGFRDRHPELRTSAVSIAQKLVSFYWRG